MYGKKVKNSYFENKNKNINWRKT